MKNNSLKTMITIGIVVVSLSIGYYFVFFLPKIQRNELILKKQIECQKDGTILYEKEKKRVEIGEDIMFSPSFKFSSKLNTCLYKGGFIQGNLINWYILDVYSNKPLAGYTIINGKEEGRNEFEQQSRILFEE